MKHCFLPKRSFSLLKMSLGVLKVFCVPLFCHAG